jgi:hypothetical protein
MQILSELIRLSRFGSPYHDRLPVPWFVRAPLSFSEGTTVHLAIVRPSGRPAGDIIGSVLSAKKLPLIRRVTVLATDKRGVLSEVARLIPRGLNIALCETVTINGGRDHYIDMFVEPVNEQIDLKDYENSLIATLRAELVKFCGQVSIIPLTHETQELPLIHKELDIGWTTTAHVKDGWISNTEWRSRIQLHSGDLSRKIDFNSVVVSAETSRRMIRYTFPRHGAFTYVSHGYDRPQAFRAQTSVIRDAGLNILASLIKRGGRIHAGHSTLIAVCEPAEELSISAADAPQFIEQKSAEIKQRLEQKIEFEEFDFVVRSSPKKGAESQIYVTRKTDRIVSPSRQVQEQILEARKELKIPPGATPVFIAQRFHDEATLAGQHIKELHEALKANDCFPVVALPEPGQLHFAWHQVFVRLWNCAGCIAAVFGGSPEYEGKGTTSLSIAQEFGFMLGQGKPSTILVPSGGYDDTTRPWANISGLVISTYSPEHAMERDHKESIFKTVAKWIEQDLRRHSENWREF